MGWQCRPDQSSLASGLWWLQRSEAPSPCFALPVPLVSPLRFPACSLLVPRTPGAPLRTMICGGQAPRRSPGKTLGPQRTTCLARWDQGGCRTPLLVQAGRSASAEAATTAKRPPSMVASRVPVWEAGGFCQRWAAVEQGLCSDHLLPHVERNPWSPQRGHGFPPRSRHTSKSVS